MKKKLLIIIILVVVLLVAGGVVLWLFVFSDKDDEPEIVPTYEFQIGETMAYLAKDPDQKKQKTVYVKYNAIVVHEDEELVPILTQKKNLIASGIEKYFNNKTEAQIRKMRGKDVEEQKDRIEVDLQEIVSDILGEDGDKVVRILFVEFVIN